LGFTLRKKLLVYISETTPIRYKIALYLTFKGAVFPFNHQILVLKDFSPETQGQDSGDRLLIGVLDFGTLLALKFCVEYIL
jgi:hypothetical protein